jgi:hypothetical protein
MLREPHRTIALNPPTGLQPFRLVSIGNEQERLPRRLDALLELSEPLNGHNILVPISIREISKTCLKS